MKHITRWFMALLLAAWAMAAHAAPSDVGIVLMHGKWGNPKTMMQLSGALAARGYRVSTPEMAWSGRRLYDVDYPAALKEVEKEVKQLRANGVKRVVVAGQSLGSNAAVAYAASGMDLDALVILAPGHLPERFINNPSMKSSLVRAAAMVAANRGAETDNFEDLNQGRQRQIRITAAAYVSYFDPEGPGAMTRSIRKIAKPLPVLLAIGTQDPFFAESKAFFDSAPAHPSSHYVALEGDHGGLPNLVAAAMLKWLEPLSQ
jgi:dienelactone hydrolase